MSVVLSLLALCSGAADVELLSGSSRTIIRDGNPHAAHFQLALPDKVEAHQIRVHLFAALSGTREDVLRLESITATIAAARAALKQPDLAELTLKIKPDPFVPPGTYQIKLQLSFTTKEKRDPKKLDLELIFPAATLSLPAKLTFEQIDGELQGPNTLRIVELSGLSRVLIHNAVAIKQDQTLAPLRVKLTNAGLELPRGKAAELQLELAAPFELGSTAGFLELEAKELAAPAKISWELKAKRSAWWIAIVALIGLGAGFLVRILLTQLIAAGEARNKAQQMLDHLNREHDAHADATFRTQIIKTREELLATSTGWDAAAILGAAEKAEQARAAAVTALGERKTAAKKELDEWRAALVPLIPAPIRRVFEPATAVLARVAELLDDDDVGEAARELQELKKRIGPQLIGAISSWRSTVEVLLQDLLGPLDNLSKATKEKKQLAIKELAAAAFGSADTKMREAIEAAATAERHLQDLENTAVETIRVAAQKLAEVAPNTAAVRAALDRLGEMLRGLQFRREHTDIAPEDVLRQVRDLHPLFRAVISAAQPDPARAKESLALLESGDYFGAIEKVRSPEGSRTGGRVETALGGEERSSAIAFEATIPVTPPRRRSGAAAHHVSARAGMRAGAPPMSIAVPASLLLLRGAMALISGVIIAAIAVVTFQASFIGTPSDLIGVFLWSFVLNASADTITTAAAKLKS